MTFYAVLLYDFGPREHVFMPVSSARTHRVYCPAGPPALSLQVPSQTVDMRVGPQLRRWVDDHTASLFTLSDQDRQALSPQKERVAAPAAAIKPDTRTPIEYFKENPWKKGSEAEEEAAKKV